jgi:acyl-CoA dehydrogenase
LLPLPSSPQRHAHLQWPFFSPEHTAFVERVEGFARSGALDDIDHHDVDASCRKLVARLGQAGLLRACVPGAYGGLYPEIDSRAVALARESISG